MSILQKIKGHWAKANFRRYMENTGFLFLEKIARMLVTLVVWAMVARFLGAAQFGVFNYALSFIFLFKVIADLGLDDIVTRELVRHEDLKNKLLGTTFLLKLCGAIFAVVCIRVSMKILAADSYTQDVVFIMSLRLLFQALNNIDFYFRSRVISKYTVYSQLIALMGTSLLCVVFILNSMPLIYFVGIVAIEAAVTSAGLYVFYLFKGQKTGDWRFDRKIASGLLKDAWPMIFSGLAVAVYMRIDQIMIKAMLNTVSVGYYAAAVRMSESFYFVATIVTASLFPALVNAKINDSLQYKVRVEILSSVLLWTAIVMSFVVTLLAQPLVQLLFGKEFLPAAAILPIHIWASVFIFSGGAQHKWAINENLQIFVMYYLILAAVVNVALNFLLLPILGIQGAAIATVVAQFVANVLANLFHEKTRPIFWMQLNSINLIGSLRKFLVKG